MEKKRLVARVRETAFFPVPEKKEREHLCQEEKEAAVLCMRVLGDTEILACGRNGPKKRLLLRGERFSPRWEGQREESKTEGKGPDEFLEPEKQKKKDIGVPLVYRKRTTAEPAAPPRQKTFPKIHIEEERGEI